MKYKIGRPRKLKDKDIQNIKSLYYESNFSMQVLANLSHVSKKTIYNILHDKYKNHEDEIDNKNKLIEEISENL